jgi:predicted LPLAT superfamily acyltransferase
MYDEFPWIKFSLLSLIFMVIIWKLGGRLETSWRIMFALCSPIGVYFALTGRSLRKR